jgi:hypothetical protein
VCSGWKCRERTSFTRPLATRLPDKIPPLLLDSLASSAKYYTASIAIFHLNGFLVLSLCTVRLLYGSGSDRVDRKAKFHYELLQRR